VEASTFWNSQGLSRPVMGLLYFFKFFLIFLFFNKSTCAQSEILGCYGTNDEGYCLLEHDTGQSGKSLLTFWRDLCLSPLHLQGGRSKSLLCKPEI
jgi:hypothetical protein